jgi:hypothetical protein
MSSGSADLQKSALSRSKAAVGYVWSPGASLPETLRATDFDRIVESDWGGAIAPILLAAKTRGEATKVDLAFAFAFASASGQTPSRRFSYGP